MYRFLEHLSKLPVKSAHFFVLECKHLNIDMKYKTLKYKYQCDIVVFVFLHLRTLHLGQTERGPSRKLDRKAEKTKS